MSVRVQQRYQLLIGAHDNLLSIAMRINKSGPASLMHKYEVRPRKDKCGVDLIADVLRFGRLWYGKPNAISNAMSYAGFFSRSQHAVARVYDDLGNVIETQEHAGDFKEP